MKFGTRFSNLLGIKYSEFYLYLFGFDISIVECPVVYFFTGHSVIWINFVELASITWESSYCFQRILAIAILSICLSVCRSLRPSHGWISQKWCKLGLSNLCRWLPRRL